MEFKGTKGEWQIKGRVNLRVFTSDEILDYPICEISHFDKTLKEAQANAKLIAAAPDLLEALQELLSFCEFHGYRNSTEIYKANKAIEKALK